MSMRFATKRQWIDCTGYEILRLSFLYATVDEFLVGDRKRIFCRICVLQGSNTLATGQTTASLAILPPSRFVCVPLSVRLSLTLGWR